MTVALVCRSSAGWGIAFEPALREQDLPVGTMFRLGASSNGAFLCPRHRRYL